MPGYTMQSRGTARTPPPDAEASTKRLEKSRVCNWASLGPETRQPTKHRLSLPY